jgi:hypothetical protein
VGPHPHGFTRDFARGSRFALVRRRRRYGTRHQSPVKLWFLRLSGWPAFLAIVALVIAFMLIASVVLTRISHRSVLQNAIGGVVVLVLLAAIVLAAISAFTHS